MSTSATTSQDRDRWFRRTIVTTRRVLLLAAAIVLTSCGSRVSQDVAPYPQAVNAGNLSQHQPQGDAGSLVEPLVEQQVATEPHESGQIAAPRPGTAVARPPAQPELTETNPAAASTLSSADAEPPCDWHMNLERAADGKQADWIIADTGAWGRAEVPGERIWIAPRTPCEKVYSVAAHEWTHHMQGVVYGDWGTVLRELAPYGGAEVVADCGALLQGATWVHYGCAHDRARNAAAAILAGQQPAAPPAHRE